MCFINKVLGIKKKSLIIISCGILVTCSSFSLLNATYLHDTDSYSLALLFISIGLYISKNIKNGNLIAISFYVISLGLYQAYIQVAIFVYIIIFTMKILNGDELKESVIQLIKDALTIIASMLFYYAIYRFLLLIFNIEEGNEYNSVSQATNFVFSTWKGRLYSTFISELDWFVYPNSNKQTFIFILNIVLVVVAVILIITIAINKKICKQNAIIMLMVFAFTPFTINVITFISYQYHALTLFPLFFCYIFVIVLLQNISEVYDFGSFRKVVVISSVALSLMIVDNCVFSNRLYLQKELVSQNTLSTMTRIIDRIEQIEGYEVGKTKVAIIGQLNDSKLVYIRKYSVDYGRATGMAAHFSPSYHQTYISYFVEYLGYPINILSEEESNKLKENEEVKKMKSFPSSDSCKIIDGIMIIKLSEKIQ